jgi:hypothetical protein
MLHANEFDPPSRAGLIWPEKNILHFFGSLCLCDHLDPNDFQIAFPAKKLLRCNPTRLGGWRIRGPVPQERVIGFAGART